MGLRGDTTADSRATTRATINVIVAVVTVVALLIPISFHDNGHHLSVLFPGLELTEAAPEPSRAATATMDFRARKALGALRKLGLGDTAPVVLQVKRDLQAAEEREQQHRTPDDMLQRSLDRHTAKSKEVDGLKQSVSDLEAKLPETKAAYDQASTELQHIQTEVNMARTAVLASTAPSVSSAPNLAGAVQRLQVVVDGAPQAILAGSPQVLLQTLTDQLAQLQTLLTDQEESHPQHQLLHLRRQSSQISLPSQYMFQDAPHQAHPPQAPPLTIHGRPSSISRRPLMMRKWKAASSFFFIFISWRKVLLGLSLRRCRKFALHGVVPLPQHATVWQPLLELIGGQGRLRRLAATLDTGLLGEVVYYVTCSFAQPTQYHAVFLRALAGLLAQRAAAEERRLGQVKAKMAEIYKHARYALKGVVDLLGSVDLAPAKRKMIVTCGLLLPLELLLRLIERARRPCELEAQNAAKEWERKRNQARIRAEIFEKAKVTIAEDLSDVVRDMSDSLKGGKLGPASKNANVEFEVSAADYALRSSELRETFVQESPNMDRDPARLLGKFLNDTIALNMEHDERSLELFTDLLSKMPTNAAKVSQPLVALLWPPPLHHPPLNSSAFRLAEGSGVCGQVANFHEAVAGFRANLTKVATMLNTTAVLLPRLPNAVPGASEEVTSFLDNMLRLSYIETIARDREASKLSRAISPAVMERLFCSAAAPLRLAGLAAASVAAAWLSSV
ncbi:unnamed protein product [Prorocentrum cordatum]|uniref:Uncharacterized protein n=1 Tax=Prorocentrum cordatum TaxID=2364126 RepID=A0ABN9TAG6_9DINO|nr:unnamed protein product [Polarella glacialis]